MTISIGERLAKLREYRNLSQERLAERAGVSVDTVRKLEQGVRLTARITSLEALARALDVELGALLGQPTTTPRLPDPEGGLIALRDAVEAVGDLPGVLTPTPTPTDEDEDPPCPAAWSALVRNAAHLYWAGRCTELTSLLPGLLRDGRAVLHAAPPGTAATEQLWGELAHAYQLAAQLATQMGHTSLGFLAVERCLRAAQHSSDPLREAMGVSSLSWVLLRQGRWAKAQQVAEAKADSIEPPFRRGNAVRLAVYGNLLLAAAVPAARQDRPELAAELVNLAESAAIRSGPVNAYGTVFSIPDVRIQAVNVAVCGSGSDPERALRTARSIDPAQLSRPLTRARHRLDIALAQRMTGQREESLDTLLGIEREQPEWIVHQVLAVTAVRDLLEAERRRVPELRALAARLGVDPAL